MPFPALTGTLTIGHSVPPSSMLNNVMPYSIQQCSLYITVLSMLVLTGCSSNINWFPSKQFTIEDWRHSPILSVTQRCVDEVWHTRTIDITDLRNCAELSVTIAEF